MKCIFCNVEMIQLKGALPEWMNPESVVELVKKSRPGLWRLAEGFYTGQATKQALNILAEKVSTFKCPKCGWLAIFDRVSA